MNRDAVSPTVIVSRRVAPGREEEFGEWAGRIGAAAARFPGHLGSETQPPDARHPDRWVTVYRFETAGQLRAWIESPERATLMAAGAVMLVEPAVEQIVAGLEMAAEPVTVVFSQKVRQDREEDFATLYREGLRLLETFPGFLGVDLYEAVPGVQDDHAIVLTFDSRANLQRWIDSAERATWLRRLEPLIEGERTVNVVGGFAGWFPPAGAAGTPKRWKQAVAVLIALYPTVLVLGVVQRALIPDVPMALGVLIGNVAGVAILTYLLMPFVTRLLRAWLQA